MVRPLLTAAFSLLGSFALPGVAHAVTQVSVQSVPGVGQVVVVNDDDASSTIDVENGITAPVDGSVRYVAARNNAGGMQAGSGCGANPEGTVVACEGVFDALVVFGNGGNDKVTMDLIVNDSPLNAEAYGDDGDDELRATPDNRDVPQPTTYLEGNEGNDILVSGNGADELLGGNGNDTMQSFQGPDTVRGEGGDDSVSAGKEEPAANAADVVDGGPGTDRIPLVDADYNRGFDDDVSVTVDGVANDGEPGEGDNVIDVENITMTANNGTLVGNDAANDFFVEANTSTVRGLGGNDRLVAYDGNDSIEGGDGDDFLEGGFGNDMLDGGPGVDQFNGDRTETGVFAVGNDTVRARDGNSEQIDCGIGGGDSVVADASDVVSTNCESVDRGPGGGFGSKTLVTLALAAGKIPARGPLKVRIANANGFAITGSVSGQTVNKIAAARAKRVKFKAKSFSVAAKGRKTVSLKLPAAMKRALRRAGKLSLRLAVRVKDPAGTTRTVTRKLTPKLKRRR